MKKKIAVDTSVKQKSNIRDTELYTRIYTKLFVTIHITMHIKSCQFKLNDINCPVYYYTRFDV